jgi:diacylglycerol kinase
MGKGDSTFATARLTIPSMLRLHRRTRVLSIRIVRSFYFAFAGLAYLFRTQRNARIELAIGVVVCAIAAWVDIGRAEWAVLVFTIALVLILEGINTAIELAVDLASPRLHPLAKASKDLAAGMVLLGAMASLAVGLLILGPPLWQKLMH